VDEADIGRIQLDQPALFTVDAFPGREFRGKVLKIRIAPRTVQNVVTYTVLISAENSDLRLLPGMTANIRIITDTRSDAVKVPNAALRFKPPAPDGAAVNPAAGPGSGRGAGADRAQPPAAGRAAAGPDAAPTFKGRVHVLDAKQRLVPLDVVLGINDGAFTELVRGDLTAGQEVVVGLAPASAAGAARPTRRFGF
jgi:HlyD family secretion protein